VTDFLFIIMMMSLTSSKRTRTWAFAGLVAGSLVWASYDFIHYRYGAGLPLVMAMAFYLFELHVEMRRRAKARLAADPTFYDYEADPDMEERGRRAAQQMWDWLGRHHLGRRRDT
jgi:hypothetical protein